MEAQISLQGNVGTTVEFSAGADWSLARFRLACTPSWRKDGEWVNGETLWVTVRASGQTAVNVRDSIRKGDPLIVVGRLRNHTWQDAEGKTHEAEQVEAVSLGHDLARGVSTFVRPERISSHFEDGPLVPEGHADRADDDEEGGESDAKTDETTPVKGHASASGDLA